MKKSIIAAGAASVALAAMPVLGAFAITADTITDNLTVNLSNTCSISRTGVAGTDATWSNAEGTTTGTYSKTMNAGNTAELGTSTISVTCNDSKNGHSLAVATSGLTAKEATTGIVADQTIDYTNSAVSNTASGWNITVNDNTTLGITSGIVQVLNGNATLYGSGTRNKTSVNGEEFTATYNVGVQPDQAAGTYEGSAVYTLTYGA